MLHRVATSLTVGYSNSFAVKKSFTSSVQSGSRCGLVVSQDARAVLLDVLANADCQVCTSMPGCSSHLTVPTGSQAMHIMDLSASEL